MLLKIPANSRENSGERYKDSGECSRGFREMFQRIPGNVQEDSEQLNFDLFLETLLVFL